MVKKGKIAPHLDKEFELMSKGLKPAGMISPRQLNKFKPLIKKGLIKVFDLPRQIDTPNIRYERDVIVTLLGEEWRAENIIKIYASVDQRILNNDPNPMRGEDHTELGKLLGYSDEDIAAFLVPSDQRK